MRVGGVGFAAEDESFPDLCREAGIAACRSWGMGVISATHKDFSTTPEKIKITVRNDKVSSWVVEPTEGAGLMAILKQLDVKLSNI